MYTHILNHEGQIVALTMVQMHLYVACIRLIINRGEQNVTVTIKVKVKVKSQYLANSWSQGVNFDVKVLECTPTKSTIGNKM